MINLKYPRTPHLSFSRGRDADDVENDSVLLCDNVIVTEKMDGSCVGLSRNNIYSRSGKPATRSIFDRLKNFHAKVSYLIPENYILYGEWCGTAHSIEYHDLPDTPLFLFSSRYINKFDGMRQEFGGFRGDVIEGFDSVQYFASLLKVSTVPVIAEDVQSDVKSFFDKTMKMPSEYASVREGLVIRNTNKFSYDSFADNSAKFVREGFEPGRLL